MKNKIMEFVNNFNVEDLKSFIMDLGFLELLSNPIIVVIFIVLGVLSVYHKWRFAIISVLSYTLLYGYLFISFVVIKNSQLSSIPTFFLLISAIVLIAGLAIYKYLIRSD